MSSFLNTYLSLFSTPLVRKGPLPKQPVEMASFPATSNFGSQSVSERRGVSLPTLLFIFSWPEFIRFVFSSSQKQPQFLIPSATSYSSSSPNGSRVDLSLSPAPSSMWSSSTPSSPTTKSGKKKTLYSLNTPVVSSFLPSRWAYSPRSLTVR